MHQFVFFNWDVVTFFLKQNKFKIWKKIQNIDRKSIPFVILTQFSKLWQVFIKKFMYRGKQIIQKKEKKLYLLV